MALRLPLPLKAAVEGTLRIMGYTFKHDPGKGGEDAG